jgi:hypothetical protein
MYGHLMNTVHLRWDEGGLKRFASTVIVFIRIMKI